MEKRNDAVAVEALLRLWENTMFMEQGMAVIEQRSVSPSVQNWADFRDYLLRYRAGDLFDEARFMPEHGTVKYADGFMAAVPPLVATWISSSKRVFRLSKEMQARFAGIKFGNIRLSDVVLPFPGFGIQLDTPIVDDKAEYGFLLATRANMTNPTTGKDYPVLEVSCIPRGATKYEGFDRDKCQSVVRGLGSERSSPTYQRNLKAMLEMARQYSGATGVLPRVRSFTMDLSEDMLIEEFIERLRKAGLDDADLVQGRICLNLCLYLQSLPPGAEKEEGVEWKKEYQKKVKTTASVITKATNVCDITGHHILNSMIVDNRSDAQRARGGWEMEPRWRRAHKRRPPGSGHDPTAEKTVKVRHYLIREDLVPEVGVLHGSLAEVR